MRKISLVFTSLFFALIICFKTADACSIIATPLRKEFREAKSVFVGKIINITDYYTPTEQEKKIIPRMWKEFPWKETEIFSMVTFEISDKWKGDAAKQKDFIAVAAFFCGCGDFLQFKQGKEYLVFAASKNFVMVCDSKDTNYEGVKKEMKRLDSFRFRAWASIYPF